MAASNIENRIISMTFDSKMFEKNIQQSMDSIDRMDRKIVDLGNAGQSLNSLTIAASKVDLSPISMAAYAASNSFSAMQIAGMTVIQNLTNSFINFGRNLWNMSIGQIKTGGWNRALNIQQAEFMLEGLGLDVAQIKQDAMAAVEGTAYGFDEAARAAATFGASGLKAGDQMKEALLGVAGVASMTGRDFSSIAHIFSTVAANGKLMGEQLSQFSYAGLNVAAELAKTLHTTEAKIHEMVSKGQIDFATFSKAMHDTFGSHAQDANKTFEGSLSNIRAALSRIGAEFAIPISNDFIPALNSLREMINVVKNDMSPLFKMFRDWSKIISTVLKNAIDKLANSKAFFNIFHGIEHILMGLITVLYTLKKSFNEVFPQFEGFTDMFRRLTIYLMPTEQALNGLANIFKVVFSVMKVVFDSFVVGIKILAVFAALAYKAGGYLLGLAASITEIIEPYVQWIHENNVIRKVLDFVIECVLKAAIFIYDLKDSIIELTKNEKFQAWLSGLMGVLSNFSSFLKELLSHINIADIGIIGLIVSFAFLFEFIKQTVLKSLGIFLYIISSFTLLAKNVISMFSAIGGSFRALTNVINKFAWELLADLIIKFAVSVAILAVSMRLLATMSWDEIIKGAAAIAFLCTILVASITLFSRLNDGGKNMPWLLLPFISLALALAALSAVVKSLGQLDVKQIAEGITALYLMSALFIIVSKLSRDTAGIDTAGFFSFGIAMLLLSLSVKTLGSLSGDVIAKGLLAIAALTIISKIVTVTTQVTSQFSAGLKGGIVRNVTKNGFAVVDGLMSFALSMVLLSAAINSMAKMISKDPEAVQDALIVVGLLSLLFIGIQKLQLLMPASSGIKTDGFIWFAVTIGMLVGSVTSLALLAHIDPSAVSKAMLTIFELVGLVVAMQKISQIFGKDAGGITTNGFIWFALTISILAGSLTTLALISHFDPSALSNAVLAIYLLAGAIAAMIWAQKMLGGTAIDSAGFLGFALTVAILAGSVTALALLDKEKVANAVLALFEMSAIIMMMQYASNSVKSIKPKGMITFGVALMLMASAMAVLVKGDVLTPDNMTNALITMFGLLLFLHLYQRFAKQTSMIQATGMVSFGSAILLMAAAVAILASLPIEKMLASAGALALLALALGTAAKIGKDLNIIAGTGLTILAGGIVALAAALLILGQAGDPGDIFMNAVSIGLLALALSGIAKIIGSSQNLNMAMVSFAVLAGSLVLLAAALKILSGVPWEQTMMSVVLLSALVIVVSEFGKVASTAIPGLLGIATVIATLAIFLISFGFTVKLIADSIMVFSEALHSLAELSGEDIQKIIDNANLFIVGLGSVCDTIVAMSPKFAMAALAIGAAISAAIGAIIIAISAQGVLGVLLFAAMIVASLPFLLEALGTVMDATGAWFEENHEKVYEFGRQLGHVLVDGILGACEGLAEAIYDKIFGQDVQESYDRWRETGEQAGNIYKENMLKAMDMYKSGEYSSEMLIAGLQAGIENGYITEEEAMAELAKRGMDSFNDELGIHSPSLEGIKAGEYTIQGVIEGIKNKEYSFSEAMSAIAEAGISSFTSSFSSSDLLDGVLGSLGLDSMLSGTNKNYRAIGLTWAGGKYAYERAGYDSIEAFVEAQESKARSSAYKNILGNILSELGLDIDLENLTEDAGLGNLDTSGLSNYSTEATKATQVTDKLKDSISSALDVFSEFNVSLDVTGRDVLANFASQLEGVASWSEELKALSAKGLNANFIQQLADQGPQAYDKIHALYTMTEQELNLFNRMYAQKIGLEKNTANDIRKSFVQNGAMTEKAAEKYGEKTSEAIASGIEKKSGDVSEKLTATEIKAAEEAAEELEKQKIDEDFIAKFANDISSEESKLVLSDAFTELGYASMDAFKKSLNYETAMAKIISFRGEIANQISDSLNLFDEVEEKEEKEKITTTELLNNMEENLKRVGGWSYNLTKMVKMGFSEGLVEYLRQMGPESADKVEAFVKMSAEEMSIANAYFRDAMTLPTGAADKLVASYSEAGFYTSLGFSEGIDPDAANDVITALGTNTLSKLEETLGIASPSTKTYQDGIYTVEGFANGLNDENMLHKLATSVGVVTSLVTHELINTENNQNGRIAGENYIDSISKGMTDRMGSIKKSIAETASAIFSNFGSLSTLDSVEEIDDSYSSLTKTFADKMKSIDLGIDDITEYKPVIHPVWSMDDIYSGTEYISDVLSKEKINVGGTINSANSANKTGPSQDAVMITNAINNLTAEQRSIRNDINNIRSDVSSLGNRIDGMRVVLDGNALVGELIAPLDKAMGNKVIKQKRGRV